ncbi:MAG: OmpA family protein [Vampirovibrionales bacterium]
MSGKKHKHAPHENLERWVVSYADFMTLLFATFTALYALAKAESADAQKEALNGIRQGFEEQSLMHGVKSLIEGQGVKDNVNLASPDRQAAGDGVMGDFKNLVPKKGQVEADHAPSGEEGLTTVAKELNKQSEALQAAMNQAAQEQQEQGGEEDTGPTPIQKRNGPFSGQGKNETPDVEVVRDKRGVRIRLNSRILFHSGSATLRPESKAVIAALVAKLKPMAINYLVQVEGHTDSQPVGRGGFPSNWELSTARASAVVRLMIGAFGFNSHQLSAAGFADTQPLASNLNDKDRAKNRRIEFLIYTDPERTPKSKPKDATQKTMVIKPHNETPDVVIPPKPSAASLSHQGNGSFMVGKPVSSQPNVNRLESQLVLSESSQSGGTAKVILKQTTPENGAIQTHVIPNKPVVAPQKPRITGH